MVLADDVVHQHSSELARMGDPDLCVGHDTVLGFFVPAFDLDGLVLVIINEGAVVILSFFVLYLGKIGRIGLGGEIFAHSERVGSLNLMNIVHGVDQQIVCRRLKEAVTVSGGKRNLGEVHNTARGQKKHKENKRQKYTRNLDGEVFPVAQNGANETTGFSFSFLCDCVVAGSLHIIISTAVAMILGDASDSVRAPSVGKPVFRRSLFRAPSVGKPVFRRSLFGTMSVGRSVIGG